MEEKLSLEELKIRYEEAVRIVRAERAIRNHFFKPGNPKREAKLAEMDTLLKTLAALKDMSKRYIIGYEQSTLIELPKKSVYP